MEQTLVIRRTGEMNREEIRRAQEAANRKALLVKRGRTAVLIGLNVLVALFVLLPLLYAVSVAFQRTVHHADEPAALVPDPGEFPAGPD